MRKLIILSVITIIFAGNSFGQDIYITFSGTGESTVVDSITATNLATGEDITLPGDETLVLSSGAVGIEDFDFSDEVKLYPNPFDKTATLLVNQQIADQVEITVRNLIGQVIIQSSQYLEAGSHSFIVNLNKPGIYLVDVNIRSMRQSLKAVSLESGSSNRLVYIGSNTEASKMKTGDIKSLVSNYTLNYTSGDVIHYRGRSGKYTTIFTDSTDISQNYEFEFIDCTDPDERTYDIVKIGDQMWMAENLAYLPEVSPPSEGSDSAPYYYVYGYEGSNVEEAKDQANYHQYGVLYNWPAAIADTHGNGQDICPTGWHLPSDEEWTNLTDYLTSNGYGYEGSGDDIGKSMASTALWTSWDDPGKVGNYQTSNNSSGFRAFPAGDRSSDCCFWGLGNGTIFCSSSPNGSSLAWGRTLYYDGDGVYRDYGNRSDGFSVRCVKDSTNYEPHNPSPSDNSVKISVETSLSWSCSSPGGANTLYDVYFGKMNPPELVAYNLTNNSFSPRLEFNQKYYWKIKAKHDNNSMEGPVWSFTTQNPQWIVYNKSNSGLPSNHTYSISIDEFNSKWIATYGGVASYNGNDWQVYNTSNSDLPDNYTFSTIIDQNGNLWIGAEGSVTRFDGTNWVVYNSSNSKYPGGWAQSMKIDDANNLWIATYGGGLAKFDMTDWTVYNTSNSDLPNNYLYSIAIDDNENIWIGTDGGGLVKFDMTKWTIYNKSNSDISSNIIWYVDIDENDVKWIGTYDAGLAKLEKNTWTLYNTSNSGIPSNMIRSVTADENDITWIGTYDAGLAKLQNKEWTSYNTSNSGIRSDRIFCIKKDKYGNKWIATSLNGGIAVFNENGVTNIENMIIK